MASAAGLKLLSIRSKGPSPAWDDKRLLRECAAGSEEAWTALVEKYKNLIYSVPIKQGLSPDDASDIFQAVCLELFSQLPRLRNVESLPGWLVTVATNKIYHWRRSMRHWHGNEPLENEAVEVPAEEMAAPELLEELEIEQMLRDGIARLPSRCRQLILLLFYEHPARRYHEIARQLGLAPGSIGFIRGRCLRRLQKDLEAQGF